MFKQLSLVFFTFVNSIYNAEPNVPIVITTWQFYNSTSKAWDVLKSGGVALDAIEMGATECEILQCDGTVGYGGSPDENSETTLDALIMDGKTMNVGAVGALRRVKNAISVARRVLDHTKHSIIVGELATEFAVQMGFQEESLITPESKKTWKNWHSNNCQPNFWVDVTPDPSQYCGPYHGLEMDFKSTVPQVGIIVNKYNHDTIGMIAVDENGNVAAGTSTNGAKFKIPGRIGDSPIPGAGAYADNEVGGAASTGDGDIMLRFLPSFIAVEEMRRGSLPTDAATTAIKRIATHYPSFMGAVIALSKNGEYGAACHGMSTFPFIVQDKSRDVYEEITVKC